MSAIKVGKTAEIHLKTLQIKWISKKGQLTMIKKVFAWRTIVSQAIDLTLLYLIKFI